MRCSIKRITLFFILSLTFFLSKGFAADTISIFVSIEPQKYFVQQIGRDRVDVQTMVQAGASPATYEPKPSQMVDLSKTEIYFAIGVPFENTWLDKIAAANPKMRVVHTDHGIEKISMSTHLHHVDPSEHHEKGEHAHNKNHHAHDTLDPHIWLSPPLVKIQAEKILTALYEVDPAHRSVYEANFREFTARIDQLDADIRKIFATRQGMEFMVFHPSWGYFAHTYGIKQVPIEIEGKEPKPNQLKELIQHARKKKIRVIFVQPQFSTKSAELMAREIGGQIIFADPLAEDWMTNLQEVADKFKIALK